MPTRAGRFLPAFFFEKFACGRREMSFNLGFTSMNINLKSLEVWFVTGSQHLYGPETLKEVAEHSQGIVRALNAAPAIPVKVVFKPVMVSPDAVTELCQAANNAAEVHRPDHLVPHIFAVENVDQRPQAIAKPVAHLHTQFNRDIPWATIDMDFMNLNQAAHGDREHGFIWSRLRLESQGRRWLLAGKIRRRKNSARGRARRRRGHDWQSAKFARFGDNMREVAVTEGDKVSAQIKFGFSVNGYGVGDLVKAIGQVTSEEEIDDSVEQYEAAYSVAADLKKGGPAAPVHPRSRAHRTGSARVFDGRKISKASRRHLKICTAWCSCPASRRSG